MIKIRCVTWAFAVFLLTGCGEPRMDTSSDDAARASISAVREALSSNDRAEFDAAMAEASVGATLSAAMGTTVTLSVALQPYDGMTGSEVLAEVRRQKAETEAKREKQRAEAHQRELETRRQRIHRLESQIDELRAIAAEAERSAQQLDQVELTNPRVTQVKDALSMSAWPFTITVRNGLEVTLTSLDVAYSLQSQDREVPWNEGTASFYVDGGLAPGESRDLTSRGDGISGYILLYKASKEHPEAVLKVAPVQVRGADRKALVAESLTDFQRLRLEQLERELAEAGQLN